MKDDGLFALTGVTLKVSCVLFMHKTRLPAMITVWKLSLRTCVVQYN